MQNKQVENVEVLTCLLVIFFFFVELAGFLLENIVWPPVENKLEPWWTGVFAWQRCSCAL